MKDYKAQTILVPLQNIAKKQKVVSPLLGNASKGSKKYPFKEPQPDGSNGNSEFRKGSFKGPIPPWIINLVKNCYPHQHGKCYFHHQEVGQPTNCDTALSARNQRGASKTATLFLLAVIGLLVHVGFRLFPIYYSYFELHNQMGSLIRVADELKDSEIRRRIEEQLKSLKIPADITDVRIERRAQTMLLSLDYVEILTLGFGDYKFDVWKFNFLCKVEDVIPQG
jgi:hypothetical protein